MWIVYLKRMLAHEGGIDGVGLMGGEGGEGGEPTPMKFDPLT